MRPRVSYLAMALSGATGGANVNLVNNGTIDAYVTSPMPGGGSTFVVTRINGLNQTILATNISLPWE